MVAEGETEFRRVRVWFGAHVIASYDAMPTLAERYAASIRRRFVGLDVTIDSMPLSGTDSAQLPAEQLWPLTVQ